MTKRAIQYARASTDMQDQSVEDQLKATAEYASKHNFTIVAEPLIDQGRSGVEAEHREAFQKLISLVDGGKPGFEYVLVYDVSRWGRFADSDEAAYWQFRCKLKGIKIIYTHEPFSVENNLANEVTKGLKRSMAAEYSRGLSRLVTRGLRSKSEQGYWVSEAPYGYKRAEVDESRKVIRVLERGERKAIKNHHVILVPGNEQEIGLIRQLFSWSASGLGEITIANRLNSSRIPSPSGRTWGTSSLHRILTNPVYIGTSIWGRTKNGKFSISENTWGDKNPSKTKHDAGKWVAVENAWEPLVEKPVFEKVQEELKRRSFIKNPGQGRTYGSRFLLTGLLECANCGGRFSGRTYHGIRRAKPYLCYRCSNSAKKGKAVCKLLMIQRERLDHFVLDKIRTHVANPEFWKIVDKTVKDRSKTIGLPLHREQSLVSQTAATKTAIQRMLELMTDPSNSNWIVYDGHLKKKREQLESLERELDEIRTERASSVAKTVSLKTVKELALQEISTLTDSLPGHFDENEVKKKIVRQFLHKGVVDPLRKEVRFFFNKVPPLTPHLQLMAHNPANLMSASHALRRTGMDRGAQSNIGHTQSEELASVRQ